MPKWSVAEVVARLKEILGFPEGKVDVVRADQERGNLEVMTSWPAKLIGHGGETIQGVEEESGWSSIHVRSWFVGEGVMLEELRKLSGLIKIVEAKDEEWQGHSTKTVVAEFDETAKLTALTFQTFKARTGWDLQAAKVAGKKEKTSKTSSEKPKKNGHDDDKISFTKAKELLMTTFPEVKGVTFTNDQLNIYVTQEALKTFEGLYRQRKIKRMIGEWPLNIRDADELPQEVLEEQILVTGPKCEACRGRKEILQPVVTWQGTTWERVICPVCKGIGRRK